MVYRLRQPSFLIVAAAFLIASQIELVGVAPKERISFSIQSGKSTHGNILITGKTERGKTLFFERSPAFGEPFQGVNNVDAYTVKK